MRVVRLGSVTTAIALVVAAGCAPYTCGWDDALEGGSGYRVTLGERYRPGSTTALYVASEDLLSQPPSCGGLDEFASGAVFDVQRQDVFHGTADSCSQWPMTVTSPVITSLGASQEQINTRPNTLRAALTRDWGGGCVTTWELTVHSPGSDPFQTQIATALPVVLASRVLLTSSPSVATACATVTGVPVLGTGGFMCGDVFISSMQRL